MWDKTDREKTFKFFIGSDTQDACIVESRDIGNYPPDKVIDMPKDIHKFLNYDKISDYSTYKVFRKDVNTLCYRGYEGSINYSKEDKCYWGKILDIKDLVLYDSKEAGHLEDAFEEAVEDYIGK